MRRARGFTLLELLVAFTLFAVVGGALLQLFYGGLRSVRLANEYTHAVLLARSKFNELQAFASLQPGILGGDLGSGYRWHAVLSKTTEEAATPRALQPLDLVLDISWGEAGDRRSFQLKSLLLTLGDES